MEKRLNATVQERLYQLLKEYDLPFKFKIGNVLDAKSCPNNYAGITGFLGEDFEPEVIVLYEESPFAFKGDSLAQHVIKASRDYAERLSRASGNAIKPEEFLVPVPEAYKDKPEEMSDYEKEKQKYIARDSVDVHAFYDKKSDLTWFFVLPGVDLLKKKGIDLGLSTLWRGE